MGLRVGVWGGSGLQSGLQVLGLNYAHAVLLDMQP